MSRCIVIAGWPGTGKSTAAKLVASQLKAVLIDRDTFMGPITAKIMSGEAYMGEAYSALSRGAYQAMWGLARENMQLGMDVVCTAPLGSQVVDPAWRESLGMDITLIWLHAPLPVMRKRLTSRSSARDILTLDRWSEFIASIDERRPISAHLALDTQYLTPAQVAAAITGYVGK